GFTQVVLTQKQGQSHKSVAYYCTALDPVPAGLPSCLHSAATGTYAFQLSSPVVLGHSLILTVPHGLHLMN
ncbi:hypothetical protein GN956_G22284, partial [Arapaima gigas]